MYQQLAGYPLWVWGLVAVTAILVGIVAARIFTLTPSQRIMRRECPECGSSKLLLTPKSRNHVMFECGDCGLTLVLENNNPQPEPAFKPTKVSQLGLTWDGETGNPIFRTKDGMAEFDIESLPIYALAEANHPREALQRLVDQDIRPVRCTVSEGTEDAWLTFVESAGIERTE